MAGTFRLVTDSSEAPNVYRHRLVQTVLFGGYLPQDWLPVVVLLLLGALSTQSCIRVIFLSLAYTPIISQLQASWYPYMYGSLGNIFPWKISIYTDVCRRQIGYNRDISKRKTMNTYTYSYIDYDQQDQEQLLQLEDSDIDNGIDVDTDVDIDGPDYM